MTHGLYLVRGFIYYPVISPSKNRTPPSKHTCKIPMVREYDRLEFWDSSQIEFW